MKSFQRYTRVQLVIHAKHSLHMTQQKDELNSVRSLFSTEKEESSYEKRQNTIHFRLNFILKAPLNAIKGF